MNRIDKNLLFFLQALQFPTPHILKANIKTREEKKPIMNESSCTIVKHY